VEGKKGTNMNIARYMHQRSREFYRPHWIHICVKDFHGGILKDVRRIFCYKSVYFRANPIIVKLAVKREGQKKEEKKKNKRRTRLLKPVARLLARCCKLLRILISLSVSSRKKALIRILG